MACALLGLLLCLSLCLLLGLLLCAPAAVRATTVWEVLENGGQRVVTAGGRYCRVPVYLRRQQITRCNNTATNTLPTTAAKYCQEDQQSMQLGVAPEGVLKALNSDQLKAKVIQSEVDRHLCDYAKEPTRTNAATSF